LELPARVLGCLANPIRVALDCKIHGFRASG
jgi:hypothetical protein